MGPPTHSSLAFTSSSESEAISVNKVLVPATAVYFHSDPVMTEKKDNQYSVAMSRSIKQTRPLHSEATDFGRDSPHVRTVFSDLHASTLMPLSTEGTTPIQSTSCLLTIAVTSSGEAPPVTDSTAHAAKAMAISN